MNKSYSKRWGRVSPLRTQYRLLDLGVKPFQPHVIFTYPEPNTQEDVTVNACRLVEYEGDLGSKFWLFLLSQSGGVGGGGGGGVFKVIC